MPIGKFGLEKTWRAGGTGTFTFNAPGNFSVPYGKNDITVEGKGGSGNAEVVGNPATYNPDIPGNVATYNPPVPGDVATYNPPVPGNVANYNPPAEVIASYNPIIPGDPATNPVTISTGFNSATFIAGDAASYFAGNPDTFIAGDDPSYYAGNPDTFVAGDDPSYFAGNADYFVAGDADQFIAGTPNYNAPVYVEAIYIEPSYWNGLFGDIFPPEILVAGSYNPASYVPGTPDGGSNPDTFIAGNADYFLAGDAASYFAGNADYFLAGDAASYFAGNADYFLAGDAASYFAGNADYFLAASENFAFIAGSPGNPDSGGTANYVTVDGNPNYNPDTPGDAATYNPDIPGNAATYNPDTPGNVATFNPSVAASPGASAFALGVSLSGSNVGGQAATYVNSIVASTADYQDGQEQAVEVPPGGQVIIKNN